MPKSEPSAGDLAKQLHKLTGEGVVVATTTVVNDEGGVLVGVGFSGLTLEHAELAVNQALRSVLHRLETNFHDCPACRARHARLTDALAALERDGASPEGPNREVH